MPPAILIFVWRAASKKMCGARPPVARLLLNPSQVLPILNAFYSASVFSALGFSGISEEKQNFVDASNYISRDM